MPFKSWEVATLTVNGQIYKDWETIVVHFGLMDQPAAYYRFTCSEGMPLANNLAAMRIKPGDYCSVTLAGQHSLSAMVNIRQVSYNADQHGVEIIGQSLEFNASNASAQTSTMEFKDKSLTQIATKLLEPIAVKWIPVGKIDETPFPRVNMAPGDSIREVIEPLARMRGVPLGTDETGHMTAGVSEANSGISLVEGKNILEGRETISTAPGGGGPNFSMSQMPVGKDEKEWGAKVASVPFAKEAHDFFGGIGSEGAYSPSVTLAEHPGNSNEMQSRSGFEGFKLDQEMINVQIVVYGWLTGETRGTLWQKLIGQKIHVKSPMLIMDQELELRAVTYSQDSRTGTRTTLELVKNVGGQADASG